MANVIRRTANPQGMYEYRTSVNTPAYDPGNWLINPDLAAVSGVPPMYWKVVGDTVVEMSQAEKDAVDATQPAGIDNHNLLTFKDSTRSGSYRRAEVFFFEGTGVLGNPRQTQVIAYVDSGAEGEVRVFDRSNGNVLGTLAITNTEEQALEITIASWPANSALIEVQMKRTSGSARQKVYLNGMIIVY